MFIIATDTNPMLPMLILASDVNLALFIYYI